MKNSIKSSIGTLALSLSLGVVGLVANPTTTQAAKWHKGTPKAMRGYWHKKQYIHYGKQSFRNDFYVSVTKGKFVAGVQVADPYNISSVKYKKVGKYSYLLKGKELYSRKWQTTKVVATKHKIKYRVLSPKMMKMKKYSKIAYR